VQVLLWSGAAVTSLASVALLGRWLLDRVLRRIT
jgi:hypothetical protein